MHICAVTAFPPGDLPLSGFGYHAVKSFCELPSIKVTVLSNYDADVEDSLNHLPCSIKRCWKYNSITVLPAIISEVRKFKPDIVWVNLLYCSFASKPVPMFMSLLIPFALRLLGFRVVILLHNFLEAVNMGRMSIGTRYLPNWLLNFVDKLVMKSITLADTILTMDRKHLNILGARHPSVKIRYAPQDLFPITPFNLPSPFTNTIFTIGYFGTYKKLETLLQVFKTISSLMDNAVLLIAGRSNFHTPQYMNDLSKSDLFRQRNVKYLGFVQEQEIPALFSRANAVVVTNSTSGGSSGVLSLCASHSRPLIAPKVSFGPGEIDDGWGIELFDNESPEDLLRAITNVLQNRETQAEMCRKNYMKIRRSGNHFSRIHYSSFIEIFAKQECRIG